MRAILTWTTVLLVLLLSGNLFAAPGEDAAWERDADAAVWDDAVERGAMPRTSFSSAGATRRSASIRHEARRMLERSEKNVTIYNIERIANALAVEPATLLRRIS